MASDDVNEGAGDENEVAASPPAKNKRKLLVIGAAALLLLGGAGGAGWWFLAAPQAHAESETAPPVDAESLVDIPEMTVNLRTADGAAKMLRVHLMLVPGELGKEAVEAGLPLVIDAYQPFLRELRPEDIAGSAATFRLKEEMLVRSNSVLGANAVRDVLIQDLVQQ